ncbi:MAG TPA: hypothetical protein VLB80_03910 [Candidatus Babeliales bacterium]|nr:hypothetical protein [Candidatus Babeliales bacterium]
MHKFYMRSIFIGLATISINIYGMSLKDDGKTNNTKNTIIVQCKPMHNIYLSINETNRSYFENYFKQFNIELDSATTKIIPVTLLSIKKNNKTIILNQSVPILLPINCFSQGIQFNIPKTNNVDNIQMTGTSRNKSWFKDLYSLDKNEKEDAIDLILKEKNLQGQDQSLSFLTKDFLMKQFTIEKICPKDELIKKHNLLVEELPVIATYEQEPMSLDDESDGEDRIQPNTTPSTSTNKTFKKDTEDLNKTEEAKEISNSYSKRFILGVIITFLFINYLSLIR